MNGGIIHIGQTILP